MWEGSVLLFSLSNQTAGPKRGSAKRTRRFGMSQRGSDGGSAFAVNWVRVCENSSGTLVEIVPLQVNKDLMTVNFYIF